MMINFFLFPFADPSVLKGAKSAKYTCERRTSDHGETIKESFEVQFSQHGPLGMTEKKLKYRYLFSLNNSDGIESQQNVRNLSRRND